MQQGSDPHTARVRSVSESTGACMRPHSAGDCKRESSPRAAPQLAKMHPRMGRRGPSRVRPGQAASGMRVRAGVAPRVASGDRAASKGKPAGGCSSFKRRVEQEHRCAAPHARAVQIWQLHNWSRPGSTAHTCTRRVAAPPPHLTARLCTAAPRSGVQSPPAGAGPAWEQLEGQ